MDVRLYVFGAILFYALFTLMAGKHRVFGKISKGEDVSILFLGFLLSIIWIFVFLPVVFYWHIRNHHS